MAAEVSTESQLETTDAAHEPQASFRKLGAVMLSAKEDKRALYEKYAIDLAFADRATHSEPPFTIPTEIAANVQLFKDKNSQYTALIDSILEAAKNFLVMFPDRPELHAEAVTALKHPLPPLEQLLAARTAA